MTPVLILVPTPIGNLEDISLRALRVLKEVDLILAEDTRTSAKLLQHYGISKPLESFHMHNEHQRIEALVQRMALGEQMALITDAGTPGISDPGYLLTQAVVASGLEVQALPGATAFVPAVVASAFPCERFVYEGFLPQKKGRQSRIKEILEREFTTVLYESPSRILSLLELILSLGEGSRKVVIARELTKLYETYHRGTVEELIAYFRSSPPRGEMVVVFSPKIKEQQRHRNKYRD